MGADAHAPQPPRPLLPPAASPRHPAAVADPSDPALVPSYARPSPWPAIHGDPAATPPRGRLRLQLRASTAQAPHGRTFWYAASCVIACTGAYVDGGGTEAMLYADDPADSRSASEQPWSVCFAPQAALSSLSDPGLCGQHLQTFPLCASQVRPSGAGRGWRCGSGECPMPGQRAGGSAARRPLRIRALRQRGAGAMPHA